MENLGQFLAADKGLENSEHTGHQPHLGHSAKQRSGAANYF